MRTTVEMKPEHRNALLALASRRGQKGISTVLAEAIESFLQNELERERRRQKLLSLAGSLSEEDRAELLRTVRELRDSPR